MAANFVCFAEENAEFAWIRQLQNFSDALTTCTLLNATLARISNRPTFDFLEKNIFSDNTVSTKTWIGLQFNTSAGLDASSIDPKKFMYVDGFRDISFFNIANNFPWGSSEPNFRGGGSFDNDDNVICVDYRPVSTASDSRPWGDFNCKTQDFVLCRRNCSSAAPTFSPSPNPTTSPTKNPTGFVSEVTKAPSAFLNDGGDGNPNDDGDGLVDGALLTGPGTAALSLFVLFLFFIIFFGIAYLRDKNNIKTLRQKLDEINGDSQKDPSGGFPDVFRSQPNDGTEPDELPSRVHFEPSSAQRLAPNVTGALFLKHFQTNQTPISTKPPPKGFPESINGDDASTLAFLRTSAGDDQSFYLESLLGPPSVMLPSKAKLTTRVGNMSGLLSKEEIDALRIDQDAYKSIPPPDLDRVDTEDLERDI